MLRYHVARLFAHDGEVMTNDHEDKIKKLPRDVRDHHIARGNLVEWDDREQDSPPAAAAAAPAPTTKKSKEE